MYKIVQNTDLEDLIYRKSDKSWIPKDSGNRDYQEFLQDVKKEGIGIVEGPDVVVGVDYRVKRVEAYPPIGVQLDKI